MPAVKISDTIKLSDGTLANGRLEIVTPYSFHTSDDVLVAKNRVSAPVQNGIVDIDLYPNTGSIPVGTQYTVHYYIQGGQRQTEYWTVPASGPVQIADIRTTATVAGAQTTPSNIIYSALGGLPYGGVGGIGAELAGNTTTTPKFLTQVGTGTASAAPAWRVIAPTDLAASPVNNHVVAYNSATGGFKWLDVATIGDITAVGDVTSGAAFSAAGSGTALTFRNATSGTVTLQTVSGALGTVTASLPAVTGVLALGGDNLTTTGRMAYVSSSGILTESSSLTTSSIVAGAAGLTTAGRMAYVSAAGTLAESSTLTTSTIVAGASNLTASGRMAYVTSAGTLTESATLTTSSIVSGAASLTTAGRLVKVSGAGAVTEITAVLGNLIYGDATPAWVALAPNTAATKKYLSMTGTGAVGAVPSWDQPASTELSDSAGLVRGAASLTTAGRMAYVASAGTLAESSTLTTSSIVSGASNLTTVGRLAKVSAAGTITEHAAVLGDLLYGDATPVWTTLSGNTTTTKKYLSQIGTGVISAIPAWDTIAVADLPTVTIAKGGTNATSAVAGAVPNSSSATDSSWTITPSLGVASTSSGTLKLYNSGSAYGVTLAAPIVTGSDYTFRLPVTAGTVNYPLITDGSGNTSWTVLPVAGGGTGATTLAGAGIVVGSANLTTQYRGVFVSAAGTLTESSSITTDSSGNLYINAKNLYTDTGTGMKIGTATNQKLAFFNSTPIVQPTGSVLTALSNLGLVATPSLASTELSDSSGLVRGAANLTTAGRLVKVSAAGTVTEITAVLGDVLYGDATPAWASLSADTSNVRKFLRTLSVAGVGQAPAWDTVTKTDVGLSNVENTALSTWAGSTSITTLGTIATGTVPWANLSGVPSSFTPSAHNLLSASHGDSTTGSAVRGDIITAQGSSPLWTRLAKGTQYQLLTGGATEPAWGAVALDQATAVSGQLPVGSGGTGSTTLAGAGIVTGAASLDTAGYIPYVSSSGVLSIDKTSGGQLFWDATNHRLGIGTASPGAKLHVVDSQAGTLAGTLYSSLTRSNWNPNASSDVSPCGFAVDMRTQGSNNFTNSSGMNIGFLQFTGYGTGTVNRLNGLRIYIDAYNAAITTAYGLYLDALAATGSGSIGSKYGIYQAGSGDKNYFAGDVGIATASPTYGLDNQSTNTTGTMLLYNPTAVTGVTRQRFTVGAGQSTVPLLSTTGTSSLTFGVADNTYLTLANGGGITTTGRITQMSSYSVPRVETGTAAPATTPNAVGDVFVDTTNHKIYVSDGTTNSANWVSVN